MASSTDLFAASRPSRVMASIWPVQAPIANATTIMATKIVFIPSA
jgi:hypothetical protein